MGEKEGGSVNGGVAGVDVENGDSSVGGGKSDSVVESGDGLESGVGKMGDDVNDNENDDGEDGANDGKDVNTVDDGKDDEDGKDVGNGKDVSDAGDSEDGKDINDASAINVDKAVGDSSDVNDGNGKDNDGEDVNDVDNGKGDNDANDTKGASDGKDDSDGDDSKDGKDDSVINNDKGVSDVSDTKESEDNNDENHNFINDINDAKDHNDDHVVNNTPKPTPHTPADPSVPRFGRRFRFSYRYMRNQVFEAENETYFPPDHIKDGLLWSIRTELLTQEKQVLQAQQRSAAPFLSLYENLTNYLGTENELDRYVSQKERNRLQKLKGDALTRYRKQLTARMVELKRRDDRKLKRFRNSLLAKTTKMGPEGVCEGCSLGDLRFHYPIVQSNETVIRKFKGNKEVFSIFTNEHCPLSERIQL